MVDVRWRVDPLAVEDDVEGVVGGDEGEGDDGALAGVIGTLLSGGWVEFVDADEAFHFDVEGAACAAALGEEDLEFVGLTGDEAGEVDGWFGWGWAPAHGLHDDFEVIVAFGAAEVRGEPVGDFVDGVDGDAWLEVVGEEDPVDWSWRSAVGADVDGVEE